MKTSLNLPKSVQISEIGPRDGLQNIRSFIPTREKIRFIHLLQKAGCRNIEITSFVNPKWIPQMRDSTKIVNHFLDSSIIKFCVLVPNKKGLELALEAGAKEVVGFLSASEIHNKNNVNMTIDESLNEISSMICLAKKHNVKFRVNIATAFGYNSENTYSNVLRILKGLKNLGCEGITLCDTTGVTNPKLTYKLCSEVLSLVENIPIGIHLHQCNGIEFANALSALSAGIRIFESASGGLGGCPFVPGARGNIATEYLSNMFSSMGIDTGIDSKKIIRCAEYALYLKNRYIKDLSKKL